MKKNTLLTKALFTLSFLLISLFGVAQSQTFTTSGTFTVPVGVTQLTVEAWGGGGAGGGCSNLSRSTGGGGGGGTYTKNTTVSVNPGDIITVTVGAGGVGSSNANGGSGGTSTFASTIPVTAIGGNGGNKNGSSTPLNGAGAGAATGITFNGGAGGTGDATSSNSGSSGGGGGGAGSTGAGAAPTTGINAGTGGTGGGGNGASGTNTSGNGTTATTLSGGGGGGRNGGSGASNRVGGNGFRGQVIVTWTIPCTTYILTSTAVSAAICQGGSASITLTGLPANLPTGTYTVTYNLGAPNAATGLTASMTVSTAGSGSFTTASLVNNGSTGITITNLTKGSCSSTISAFNTSTITVNQIPTANAGSALTDICQGGTTALLGGTYGGAATSAVWSTTSGGTFANNTGTTPNTATWTPPAGYSGTATLILTTSGGSCTATTASKTQIVNATPTVSIGSALADICQGGTTVALGGAYGGSATSAIWSTTSGGTFTNNGGTTPNTTTWTPTAGFTGTATLVLTTAGGSCGTVSNTKTQVVNLAPTANAGSALATICQNGTTAALGGTYGGSATGATWSTTSGGTFANNGGSTPNTTTWTPPVGFTGTATLVLTTAGGTCTATTVSKTQLVSGPTANAGSALATICQGSTTVALGGSYGGSATSAVWSDGGVGGTFANNTGTTPGTATWTPPAAYTGTATLTLTTSGGSCGTVTASKTQIVNALPTTANAGIDQTLAACATTATLAGNTATIGTGTWSVVSGTATITTPSSPTSAITGLSLGASTTLRWSITNGGCTISSDDVIITTVSGPGCLVYCSPTYSSGTGSGNSITNVTLGTLNNTSGASSSPYYTLYNATTIPNLVQSTTVSVTLTFGSDSNQYAAVWIDFNQNGTFEVSEGFVTSINAGSNGIITINIPIPAGALTGNTRMRVRGGDDNSLTTSQTCGASNSSKGETEDYIVNIASPTPLTNGPGGVMSNLQLWFRSDLLNGTSTVADGTSVSTWNTQARGTNATVYTSGQEPKYYNNTSKNINFNAVVDFTNDYNNAPFEIDYTYKPQQYLQGTSGYYTQDMFVVVLPDTPISSTNESMDIFCGDSPDAAPDARDGSGIGFGKYTVRTDDEVISYSISTTSTTTVPENQRGYGVAQTGTTITYNNVGIINTRNNFGVTGQELYYNALNISNKEVGIPKFTNLNDTRYWIGRSQAFRGSLDGRVGEIITFSSRVSDIQRSNVQSYLAIKYGITLGVNGTSMNYTNSDGNTIWNTNTGVPANDVFNYDIAGIGRDDLSKLSQKQSKTVNTNDDITIGLTDIAITNTANTNTFDSDKKFLVWGNNHGTLAAQAPVVVDMSSGITPAITPDGTKVSFISVGRTWKVVETGGNVPTAKVSIPTSMLSATLTPPGDYLMFISSTSNFDPTAEYRIMRVNGSNLETDYDFDGTKYITFGFAPEKTYERSIAFDGTNDYLDAGKVLNLNTSFTVSSWIKRNSVNQTIISKRDNTFTTGYDLSINSAGKAEMSWINGTKQTITSSVVIPSGIWHNVAVSYNGTTAKLYIDGVLDITQTMPIVPANTQSFLIAAADGVATTSYFNGNIDEVRVWNVALSDKQLRYVMNQEILSNGLATNGSIIPNTITLNEISPIPWSNLSAYYPMSTYTYTNAKDVSNNHYTAALRNLTTVDLQTAPLPYESIADGPWQTAGTWKNNTVQDLPNSNSLIAGTVDWNIVKTSHDITSTGNKTVLGLMLMNDTKKITASNNSKIEVTNYLKLDGKIDLVGMSQLVQTLDCDLDVTSKGSIERDQQGQANTFNYNYWCSPVSPINTIANNTDYTVAGIMKDGFIATPRDIKWIAGYDGIPGDATTAMSIARYWLYTFDNKTNAYSNWNKILETTSIRVGLGFTMKGSGGSGTQNYTFVGKPNNGLINTNTVLSDQLLLTGNPYPSALDADAFINDNAGSVDRGTDGTLYFWEHYSTNNTHVLNNYQGGYAVKNLVGGVAPVSSGVDFISQSGTPSKGIPNRYIPVGQGFFVNGKIGSGGTIIFKNSQRAFFKETDAVNSNSVYKTRSGTSKVAKLDHWNDNSNDSIQKDIYKRIRLGFNSNNNYHRQVLLGFMNEKATSELDYGYDGISLDELPNDMYFLNGENELVIQGEGYFNEDASFPIGVKTDVDGTVSFTIDALENFDEQQKVYIYDAETKAYNEIQKNAFEIKVPAGVNNTRFSLRFKDQSSPTDKTLSVEENNTNTNDIKLAHIQNSNILKITNNSMETLVEKVSLFNINGQTIANWKIENQDQKNIQISINSISSGVYVAKLKTTTGEVSKKIIIK